jgi:diacylglycerol O-acyltransferase / wax synthase
MTTDRLTALDASFVWFEHPGAPAHIGSVATFEAAPLLRRSGRLRLDEIRRRIDARLDPLPRLRRRLATVPYDLDRPCWVDDPAFDIARHVTERRLPAPGDDATLRRVAGELMSEVLPRDRPLWDLVFLTGLDGGRVGLVERIHHAMVDGVSGVDLATLILDLEPDVPAPPPPPAWTAAPLPDDAELVSTGLRHRVADPLRMARAAVHAMRHPTGLARALRTVANGLGPALADGLAPRSSLNGPLLGARRLAWVRTDVGRALAAGHDAGATLNDVVLAAVTGGLRRLLLGRGETLPYDAVLKAMVPVSLRGTGDHDGIGNRVGAIYAPLPVGIGDPAHRLAAVAEAMRRHKSRPEADGMGVVLAAADALPPIAARWLTGTFSHQPFVNLVVTNVPGPPFPLYLAGARMLEAYPVVPLAANLTVGVAVLSYDGSLAITLTADDRACPDVDVFAEGIERSLAQLGVADVGTYASPPVKAAFLR